MILDEPTSALEGRAEAEVLAHFRHYSAGRTAVLITTCRVSSVRRPDRVIVFAGKQMWESGSHAELLAAGRRYAESSELQAAGYCLRTYRYNRQRRARVSNPFATPYASD